MIKDFDKTPFSYPEDSLIWIYRIVYVFSALIQGIYTLMIINFVNSQRGIKFQVYNQRRKDQKNIYELLV